jgi:hypothetical protein
MAFLASLNMIFKFQVIFETRERDGWGKRDKEKLEISMYMLFCAHYLDCGNKKWES